MNKEYALPANVGALLTSDPNAAALTSVLAPNIWVVDDARPRRVWLSPGARALVDVPAADGSLELEQILHPDDVATVRRSIRISIQTGDSLALDRIRVVRGDGASLVTKWRGFPVRDDAGSPRCLIGTVDAENQAVLSNHPDDAAYLRKHIETLAQALGHDFGAAARGIATCLGWLEEGLHDQLSPDNAENLELLQSRARRLTTMVKGSVVFTRSLIRPYKIQRIDSATILEEAIGGLPSNDAARVQVANGLPFVSFDRSDFRTVFENLLSNALAASADGIGLVRVSARVNDDSVRFFVTDDGPGIEPAQRDWAFRLFTRLDSNNPGTGIGLAQCRALVERAGGTMGIDADIGAGTTVWFTASVAS